MDLYMGITVTGSRWAPGGAIIDTFIPIGDVYAYHFSPHEDFFSIGLRAFLYNLQWGALDQHHYRLEAQNWVALFTGAPQVAAVTIGGVTHYPGGVAQALAVKPRPPVAERKCRRCKTQTMRSVVLPDTTTAVAFCRLCGTQEEL